jgi:hypothetical protein
MNETEYQQNLADGKKHRFAMWLKQVEAWATKHQISVPSAISILFETGSDEVVTQHQLHSWVEKNAFYDLWNHK